MAAEPPGDDERQLIFYLPARLVRALDAWIAESPYRGRQDWFERTVRSLGEPVALEPEGPRIGIVDTTFSRVDMGKVALDTLRPVAKDARLERLVVPGVKDLPAAARRLLDEGSDLVVACGMVGPEEVDKVCGHEASMGLMWLRAELGRPILEVFVHMDEPFERDALGRVAKRPSGRDEVQRYETALRHLAIERTREHALNAYWLLYEPEKLAALAGTGQRQGYEDAGPID
jgi:riboflavin synthase